MAECNSCGDSGVVFIGCCSGFDCGCMGYPVLAKKCKCGTDINELKMSGSEKIIFENVEFQDDAIK